MYSIPGTTFSTEKILEQVYSYHKRQQIYESAELLFTYLTQKKSRVWNHDMETMMLLYIDISLEVDEIEKLEEALVCYRLITQESNAGSLEKVLQHLIEKFQGNLMRPSTECSQLSEEKFHPFNSFIAAFDPPKILEEKIALSLERIKWVFYFILSITFGHKKLEKIYTNFVKICVDFYITTNNTLELKTLCKIVEQQNQEMLMQRGLVAEDIHQQFEITIYLVQKLLQVKLYEESLLFLQSASKFLDQGRVIYTQMNAYFKSLTDFFDAINFLNLSYYSRLQYFKYQKKLFIREELLIHSAAEIVLTFMLTMLPSTKSEAALEKRKESLFELLKIKELTYASEIKLSENVLDRVPLDIKEAYYLFQGHTALAEFNEKWTESLKAISKINIKIFEVLEKNTSLVFLLILKKKFRSLKIENFYKHTNFISSKEQQKLLLYLQLGRFQEFSLNLSQKYVLLGSGPSITNIIEPLRWERYALFATKPFDLYKNLVHNSSFKKDNREKWLQEQKASITGDQDVLKELSSFTIKNKENKIPNKLKEKSKETLKNQYFYLHKKEKIDKLVTMNPQMTLLNKLLKSFSVEEIIHIDLDMLDDLEEQHKKQSKDKTKEILQRKFNEYDYLVREAIKVWLKELPSLKSEEEVRNLIRETRSKQQNLFQRAEKALPFVADFQKKLQAEKEAKFNLALKDFRQQLTDDYRGLLLRDAEAIYRHQEEKKAQELKKNQTAAGFKKTSALSLNDADQPGILQRGETANSERSVTILQRGDTYGAESMNLDTLSRRKDVTMTLTKGTSIENAELSREKEGPIKLGEGGRNPTLKRPKQPNNV